jgi:hypothetical protein
MVLLGNNAILYSTGAEMMNAEWGRCVYEPTIAIVLPTGPPHIFTGYPEGVPPGVPSDHVHGPLLVEFDEGVAALASALTDIVGAGEAHVGFDDFTAATNERRFLLIAVSDCRIVRWLRVFNRC